MKLRFSTTSPYARKVQIVAIEKGLDAAIEVVPSAPFAADSDVHKDNPLGKVPALVLADGQTLFDSPVICEYLDAQDGNPSFFPAPGPARWIALRRQALGDGIMDAAILRRVEATMRTPEQRSPAWLARQEAAIRRALDALEQEAGELDGQFTIGEVTILCALDYLDLRFSEDRWRDGRPALAAWFERISQRPSAQASRPKE
nr:glutathione S-transferase N-terminal domain-containing protein [Telmatospirillum sp. J64-1]